MGEFGPILLVTLVLTSRHPVHEALILVAFIALAVFTGVVAVRSAPKGWGVVERTLEGSGQLGVRLAVVLIFGLVALATELGLDLLLGGFVAGMITRLALRGREVAIFESKLTAIGYGFLIPFFFVVSGMAFDAEGLVTSPGALAKLPLFVLFFLLVRGIPALLLYRRELGRRDRFALGVLLRHGASPRRRDHDDRPRAPRHARDHGDRARRRGDHLHARLSPDRPASAARAPPGAGGDTRNPVSLRRVSPDRRPRPDRKPPHRRARRRSTGRSTGSAARASTRRACSARSWTRTRAATSASPPTTRTRGGSSSTSRTRTSSSRASSLRTGSARSPTSCRSTGPGELSGRHRLVRWVHVVRGRDGVRRRGRAALRLRTRAPPRAPGQERSALRDAGAHGRALDDHAARADSHRRANPPDVSRRASRRRFVIEPVEEGDDPAAVQPARRPRISCARQSRTGAPGSRSPTTAAAGARWCSARRSRSSCSPTSRPAQSSRRRRRACPSRSAARGTGTTATRGSATRPSRSTRLLLLGFKDAAEQFMEWLTDRFREVKAGEVDRLRVMYRVDGSSDLEEEELDHLEGYCGSRPVRDRQRGGHPAPARHLRRADRRDLRPQQVRRPHLLRRLGRIPRRRRPAVRDWDQPDEGIWETRGGRKDFVFSRLQSLGRDRPCLQDRRPAQPARRRLPLARRPRPHPCADPRAGLEREEEGVRPVLRSGRARRFAADDAAGQVRRADRPALALDARRDQQGARDRQPRPPLQP